VTLEEQRMNTSLAGRTAIITGAGTGIGAATAEELGRLGMRLVLVGRREEVIAAQASRLVAQGVDARAMAGDVRDFGALEAIVARTVEAYGRVDTFVANAAVADFGPIDKADPALWQDVIMTNVMGVLYSARAVLPQMYRQNGGHIVIVASGSGRTTYVGEPAYVASKHAVVAFADCLRMEVTPRGVRVSVIEPGLVETPLIHVYPEADSLVPGVIPLLPVDIARAVVYVLDQPPNCNVFEIALRPTTQV
jgi:NADP-dependent 3-hydroxy acid dehydrogenase YdfG